MKRFLYKIWLFFNNLLYSFPIQLFILSFRKRQILTCFILFVFLALGEEVLVKYGAVYLFVSPEYLGSVSFLSKFILGAGFGFFIISWNITGYVLLVDNMEFLAVHKNPFVVYCCNNFILPLLLLIRYQLAVYAHIHDTVLPVDITINILHGIGFWGGFILIVSISVAYFKRIDRTVEKRQSMDEHLQIIKKTDAPTGEGQYVQHVYRSSPSQLKVKWIITPALQIKRPRSTKHYSEKYIRDTIFKYNTSAIIPIFFVFLGGMIVGFFPDNRYLQIPAGASTLLFMSILMATAGVITVLFRNWTMPLLIVCFIVISILVNQGIIKNSSKAFGLAYDKSDTWPLYTHSSLDKLASTTNMDNDKKEFINRLEHWKRMQQSSKPDMYLIDISGGGNRSAAFAFATMQMLDSILHGQLMRKTFLINGASGGMLAASYYRELFLQKTINKQPIDLQDKSYYYNVCKDLLNPIFSAFITRDLLGPVIDFKIGNKTYNQGRGYAFEHEFDANTNYVFHSKNINSYLAPEDSGLIPTIIFNTTITRDLRSFLICSRPVRFLMKEADIADTERHSPIVFQDIDMIDFNSFFKKQEGDSLNFLTAIRMNASFPLILPSVILPSRPNLLAMDAGVRDNLGQNTTLRFLEHFRDWISTNVNKVVLIQISDRVLSSWDNIFEPSNIISFALNDALAASENNETLQHFFLRSNLHITSFSYPNLVFVPFVFSLNDKTKVSLSFHLTDREKELIQNSTYRIHNQKGFSKIKSLNLSEID
ncbi:MAG: hypothetical protein QM528_04375 [Phycisphaerales bacterium]|nr:hypothetical protein [Phycisphaerales bacterium]